MSKITQAEAYKRGLSRRQLRKLRRHGTDMFDFVERVAPNGPSVAIVPKPRCWVDSSGRTIHAPAWPSSTNVPSY